MINEVYISNQTKWGVRGVHSWVTVARRLTFGLLMTSISSIVSPRRALMLRSDFFAASDIPGLSSSGGLKLICNFSPAGR
jgi:hypothetical protein